MYCGVFGLKPTKLLGIGPRACWALPAHDVVDPGIVVEAVGERLADLLVRGRTFPSRKHEIVQIEGGHVGDDDSLGAVQFLDGVVRQEERDIDLALLQEESLAWPVL